MFGCYPDATVSTNGKGITYMESSVMMKSIQQNWWKNIDTCEPDTNGNCHYDDDNDDDSSNPTARTRRGGRGTVCYVSDDDDNCSSYFATAATVQPGGCVVL
mmetsp:Transcript_14989/g.14888  ORF Transcript_14989/g.14888 Transcript_14989/m.14888 type:complete len:102 (+) Transcript_14989:158-463(+)